MNVKPEISSFDEKKFDGKKKLRHSYKANKALVEFFKEFDRIMGSEIGEDEDESD